MTPEEESAAGDPMVNKIHERILRAKPVPSEDRERFMAALADRHYDFSDPSQWMSDEDFKKALAAHPGAPKVGPLSR